MHGEGQVAYCIYLSLRNVDELMFCRLSSSPYVFLDVLIELSLCVLGQCQYKLEDQESVCERDL